MDRLVKLSRSISECKDSVGETSPLLKIQIVRPEDYATQALVIMRAGATQAGSYITKCIDTCKKWASESA